MAHDVYRLTDSQLFEYGRNVIDELADAVLINALRYIALAAAALIEGDDPVAGGQQQRRYLRPDVQVIGETMQ